MRACRWCARSGAAGCALAEPHRAAIYYVPAADDPLWPLGCAWLGRDPERETALEQPAVQHLAAFTESPRRYGLHATLKPPMALAAGLDAFLADAASLAASLRGFDLPPLAIADLDGFLALTLAAPCPPMHDLADRCVAELDHHRRPESAEAQARRAAGRSAEERENIARWGYPLVFGAFRFHMTLSERPHAALLAAAAHAHFAGSLDRKRRVTAIAVFTEAGPGAPMRLLRRLPFGG